MRRIAPHCGSLVVAGRSYFDHLREQQALKPVDCKTYRHGVVGLRYQRE
ncbi:Protein of unknown function [Thermobacillus xylanilyticus]|uniref:Uncharacterized protein n=1 Tax=Thermobacillus xylanilyticus TaxID=76633 RepID=A0ABM8V2G5_THEXY|nr:Protein of unknown function [Thermobacillus xylanilyticus]